MARIGTLRWKMLALMLLGTVIIYVDRNVLGVLAPILKKELNFTTEQYSYVVSSFQIVYSFSQPVAGYLTDLIGPRIGYAVAALIWGTAAALHAFSTGWVSMAGFRGLLGLSEAVAGQTLANAGLVVGNITSVASSQYQPGQIVSSNPGTGASVPPGTAVDIAVSSGPPATTTTTSTSSTTTTTSTTTPSSTTTTTKA